MGFLKDRSDLYERLSRRHKLVLHKQEKRKSYHRLNDEEELIAACVNWAHFPCVVHFGLSGKYSDRVNDIPKRNTVNELLFLSKSRSINADEIAVAKDEAFTVMEDFMAWMIDQVENHGYCGPFENLSRDMFSFSEHGPVNANLFGWRLVFRDDTDAPEFNSSNWIEEE